MGEHLGCSPCGVGAGRERGHRLAWPGGAAVALAKSTLDYTQPIPVKAAVGGVRADFKAGSGRQIQV